MVGGAGYLFSVIEKILHEDVYKKIKKPIYRIL